MTMTHAIRIHKTGGPEVLIWEEIPLDKPGQGEVRIRHTAIGLNYIDTYHRSGLNPLPLPTTIGMEAAGVVEGVGPGVANTAKRADLLASAKDLFDVVASGAVKIEVSQTYALKDAVKAHRDLQDRKTTGSTVFTV